jgi:cytochrome c553
MMRFLKRLATLALAVLAAGAVVFWMGLFNISASSGHWAVTDWVLHTAMRRSVAFHAAGVEVPDDLDDPARIRAGAGHYQTGCAPCHGSPVRARGAVALEMTPHPPDLRERINAWEPEQLFWIVKHGVKFTGMPAWPTQERDDEAWTMAAFLLAMPGMTEDAYLRLAFGEAAPAAGGGGLSLAADPVRADCVRCHGDDGVGDPNGAFPRLDIQTREYLSNALEAYHGAKRASGIMQAAVSVVEPEVLAELADSYARPGPLAPAPLAEDAVEPEVLLRGALLARQGLPEENVGACLGCHGEAGETSRPEFPRIAGQYARYLEQQLRLFAAEDTVRGGSGFAALMESASHQLSPSDIEAVSAYFATRDPE